MKKLLLITVTPLLLMGCTNHGGGFGGAWKFMDTGKAGTYTCDDVTDTYTQQTYCATGEHPNLCSC